MLFTLLSGIFGLVGFVCWVFMVVEAFRDAVWKGIVGLFCGLYLLYFVVFEWEHENKWLIFIGCLACNAASAAMLRMR